MEAPAPSPSATADWLSTREAIHVTGLSNSWFTRARKDGVVEYVKHRNTIRYRRDVIERLINDNTVPAKPRKTIQRRRTPEHNAKIAASVKARQRSNRPGEEAVQ